MKPKLLQVRVDDEFLSILEYLKQIQGSKSISDTVRKIVKNEYQRKNSPIKDDILYCHRSKRTFENQFRGDTLWNRHLSQVISICKDDQTDSRPWLIIKKTSHYDIIGELDENGEYKETIEQEPKMLGTIDFAEWVAREIFDEMWEYNKDAFAELACRKLAKLGIVKATGDKWELVRTKRKLRRL